jgi:hypothetical protein
MSSAYLYEGYPQDAEGDVIVTQASPHGKTYLGYNPAVLEGRSLVAVEVHQVPILLPAFIHTQFFKDVDPSSAPRKFRTSETHHPSVVNLKLHADLINFESDFPVPARRVFCKIINAVALTLPDDSIVATIVSGYFPKTDETPGAHTALVDMYARLGFEEKASEATGGGDTLMLADIGKLKAKCLIRRWRSTSA